MAAFVSHISSWTEFAILAAFGFIIYRFLTSQRLHYPPGPKPLPIIGNVHQVPKHHPEERFTEWANKYGDVVYTQMFQQPMVILNSLQAARDLMEKRSSIYSDRPRFVLFSELMGWQGASTHVRYGPRFRKHRRFINQTFNQRASPSFRPLQEQEALVLLNGFTESPHLFVQHFRRYAAATILKITYGHDVTSIDDLFVHLAERAGTLTVESGSPAATLVDYFPSMRHIPTWAPFSGFKRDALKARKAVETMMDVPFEMVKARMKSGTAPPSFTSTLLETRQSQGSIAPEDEEDIKGAAGTLYAAAEDTTVSVLEAFILAMVQHPGVFKKAQEELDSVVGTYRLPTPEDRPSLPYFECVLKEVCRWNPPVPLGMPHRLMEDDVYQGYHIPEGSTVIANIYAILQDCSQPHLFLPERFLDDSSLPDPRDVIFGFGRRICPGRHFADTGIWSVLTSITASFDISKALDADGNKITPALDFTDGFVR
ncbi:cytochrome P450 [Infundibulicybe gibba]|nr:cytochrome P450 [Infundibulicybe gibba]